MRPIDADALIEKCGGWYVEEGTESGFIGTLKNLLATEPTVQPVATDTNVRNNSEIPNSSDTVSRQAAIDALDKRFDDVPMELTTEILQLRRDLRELPSAQPEPLTDKEQRIFLAAMKREEKVCKQVDGLVRVCHEIKRKVKGALWTI